MASEPAADVDFTTQAVNVAAMELCLDASAPPSPYEFADAAEITTPVASVAVADFVAM